MSDQVKENTVDEKSIAVKQVPINHIFPDDLQSHFVTHFVAQNREDHFILSAFEAWPPIIIGSDEERKAALKNIDSVNAKCVGRWVLTPGHMVDLVALLQTNLDKYFESIGSIENSEQLPDSE